MPSRFSIGHQPQGYSDGESSRGVLAWNSTGSKVLRCLKTGAPYVLQW